MPEIEIRVQNKKATLKSKQQESIICCNSDYELVFEFDEEWSSHEWKRVRCVSDGYNGRVAETQVGPTNRCMLPAVHNATYIDIGVYVDGGIRTSTPLQLTCEKPILCE